MANYHSLKNASIIAPVSNTDLGSPSNKYGNLYMSGNISLNGTTLNSTNAVAPRVSSISYGGDDTATLPAGGATITITGSGFGAGASVYVGGTIVGVASVVNSTQVTFTSPAKTAGNYSLAVVNADGASALYVAGLQYSGVPAWSTSAGSLGSVAGTSSGSFTVAATSDSAVAYSLYSGTLPSGLSLNSLTGIIVGTADAVSSSSVYNFTIRATDAEKQDTDRNFSITVTAAMSVEYLVVGGGGGGAGSSSLGGGGGGGGMVFGPKIVEPGSTYTVTVGAGGVWGENGGAAGVNSSLSKTEDTTIGLGGGAGSRWGGGAGGSGGGGGEGTASAGGAAQQPTSASGGYGNAGGSGSSGYGGSGGGAGAAGAANSPGGAGRAWPVGSSTYYAGGGGPIFNPGGIGGGGGGPYAGEKNGTANTGGGGGGNSGNGQTGGAGGSGVVIIRYSDISPAVTSTTGSPTVTVAGGYRTYKFTASGSITF